jgi:DNA repair protein RadC
MNTKTHLEEINISYSPTEKTLYAKGIRNSRDAFDYLKTFYSLDTMHCQEQFVVLYLNRANRPLGGIPLFKGGLCSTTVDFKLLLGVAVKALASGIIISHNHPTGTNQPSAEDKVLTTKLKDACKLMDIQLYDHIIVAGNDAYYSFADEGEL